MKYITQFTPAETLLVLYGNEAVYSDLLKITLMDLLLKRVLTTTEVKRNIAQRLHTYTYVTTGANFKNYQALPHEEVFLKAFKKAPDLDVLFRHVVKMGFQQAWSLPRYVSKILKSPRLTDYLSQNILQRIAGKIQVTVAGFKLRENIHTELANLDAQILQLNPTQGTTQQTLVAPIYGHVFLLKQIDLTLWTEVDQIFKTEMSNQTTSAIYGGCSGGGDWGGFDTGCSSHGGHSGCGGHGCSGCGGSGCSGCGGCGGCGS
jgi:hypothetical protein